MRRSFMKDQHPTTGLYPVRRGEGPRNGGVGSSMMRPARAPGDPAETADRRSPAEESPESRG